MAQVANDKPITQILEYVRIVAKYKWFIAISTLALTLSFTALIAKLPNVYEATTTILVDPQQVPEKYVMPVVSSDPYARLNTITQQVLSRSRLELIMNNFKLYSDKRASLSTEELVAKMRYDITIQVKQGSGPELSTFTITYQGSDPETVAQVANELATSFIDWNVNTREQQVAGTKEFVTSELQEAKHSLEQQEDKLRQFKMSHLGETPDQTVNNLQALSGLRTALQNNSEAMNRLEQERILLTRLPDQVPAGTAAPASMSQRDTLQAEKRQLEATIQQLKAHYSDRYPDVVRSKHRLDEIDAQLKGLPADTAPDADSPIQGTEESANAVRLELNDKEMKRLKNEQIHTQNQIGAYQAKVDAAPLREQQLVELTRNYEISRQHYQTLLDKSFNLDMAADLEQKQKGERFTVLDAAQVPTKPVKPRRKLFIPMSAMFALGLSVLGVLGKETMNPAIKTEAELKSLLPAGVRVMGLIPRIETVMDTRFQRWWDVLGTLACILLFLAEAGMLWRIRPLL
jgi:polysaccharide chain length determinant protein (PEP-CTERM system associated)